MDRRRFLQMLGLVVPAVVAPKYFFAPVGGWHSDVVIKPTLTDISALTLDRFIGELAYDNFFLTTPMQIHLRKIEAFPPTESMLAGDWNFDWDEA